MLTIVIPMYNNGAKLIDYFNSFKLEKNGDDIHYIIVDDVSIDDSFSLIKNYLSSCKYNVNLLQNHINTGPGGARNLALKNIESDYFTFMDADDDFTTSFYSDIIDLIKCNITSDCIIFNYNMIFNNKVVHMKSLTNNFTGEVSKKIVLENIRNHTVCKIYHKKILNNPRVSFPLTRRCEDVYFTFAACAACENFTYIDKYYYNYYHSPNSLSSNKELGGVDMKESLELLSKVFRNEYFEILEKRFVIDGIYGSMLLFIKEGKSNKFLVDIIKSYNLIYPNWKCSVKKIQVGFFKKLFINFIRHQLFFPARILVMIHNRIT